MANLKFTVERGPTGLGAETGRIHVGIFHTPDCSPQSLTALMPNSSVMRHTVLLPFGSALTGAIDNTPGQAAWLQQPDGISREDRLEDSPMPNSSAG
jgi:hypothetical protein